MALRDCQMPAAVITAAHAAISARPALDFRHASTAAHTMPISPSGHAHPAWRYIVWTACQSSLTNSGCSSVTADSIEPGVKNLTSFRTSGRSRTISP